MNYSDYQEAENLLKGYYENKDKIKLKTTYLSELEKSLKEIQSNLINASVVLNTDLKGVNYDKISVKGGQLPCSDMEKQIESIFSKLEKEKENIENEIIVINTEILILNKQNRAIESIINLMSDENIKFVELRYKKKLSFDKIADISHISKTALRRKWKIILSDMLKFNRYLDVNKKRGSKTAQKRSESGPKLAQKRLKISSSYNKKCVTIILWKFEKNKRLKEQF